MELFKLQTLTNTFALAVTKLQAAPNVFACDTKLFKNKLFEGKWVKLFL